MRRAAPGALGGALLRCRSPVTDAPPPHWPLQGLFERHKLLVATQLCMRILQKRNELSQEKFEYLLRGPKVIRWEVA